MGMFSCVAVFWGKISLFSQVAGFWQPSDILLIQASPPLLLIAFCNPAGDFLDPVKFSLTFFRYMPKTTHKQTDYTGNIWNWRFFPHYLLGTLQRHESVSNPPVIFLYYSFNCSKNSNNFNFLSLLRFYTLLRCYIFVNYLSKYSCIFVNYLSFSLLTSGIC